MYVIRHNRRKEWIFMITWTTRWCKEDGGYTYVAGKKVNEKDIFELHQITIVPGSKDGDAEDRKVFSFAEGLDRIAAEYGKILGIAKNEDNVIVKVEVDVDHNESEKPMELTYRYGYDKNYSSEAFLDELLKDYTAALSENAQLTEIYLGIFLKKYSKRSRNW